jgi:predicted phosphodiesterase
VLVFGGPYGNLQATRAVLDVARRLGIPAHRVICTGDLAAYFGDPVATIDLVRAAGIHCVMGNCDEQLASGADDCGCGFADGSACDRLSAEWFARADAAVGSDQRRWLGALPRRLDVMIGSRRLAVIHGSLSRINAFVFATTPLAEKADALAAGAVEGCDGIIGGHAGMPFSQVIDGRLWHNAGVAGMPANDGTARVWYSLLTPAADGIEVAHEALGYDHRAAMDAMLRGGFPDAYRTALASGLWPSLDVLPPFERTVRGQMLAPSKLEWRRTATDPGLGAHWPPWPVEAEDVTVTACA